MRTKERGMRALSCQAPVALYCDRHRSCMLCKEADRVMVFGNSGLVRPRRMYQYMPFQPSERVLYNRNPLSDVICQVRFPPILRITAEDPVDFQDRIRGDYPLYRREEPLMPLLPPELASIVRQFALPRPAESIVHRFSSKDSSRSITVSQGFLALTESTYGRWESFRAELVRAIEGMEQIYRPAFYTRIGLR